MHTLKMGEVKGMDARSTKKLIHSPMVPTAILMNTKPTWMNTEEINEDIRGYQKEFVTFAKER